MGLSLKEIIYKNSDKEFIKIVKNNFSLKGCLIELGISTYTEQAKNLLKDRIRSLNIDVSHFYNDQSWKKYRKYKYSLEEILVDNFVGAIDGQVLIKRLIDAKLKKYECEHCGNKGLYNGQSLRLQLHHKNGIHSDNRIENLEILCPNCHTQTDTYAGKKHNERKNIIYKRKKYYCQKCEKEISHGATLCEKCYLENLKEESIKNILRPKESIKPQLVQTQEKKKSSNADLFLKTELENLIKTQTFSDIARTYGVSRTTIKRWCNKLGIETKSIYTKDITPEMIEMYNNGMKIYEIASIFKIDTKRLSRKLKEMNLLRTQHKPINQYTKNGDLIKEWTSMAIAVKSLEKKDITHIAQCANGQRKTAYGYVWRWPEEKS